MCRLQIIYLCPFVIHIISHSTITRHADKVKVNYTIKICMYIGVQRCSQKQQMNEIKIKLGSAGTMHSTIYVASSKGALDCIASLSEHRGLSSGGICQGVSGAKCMSKGTAGRSMAPIQQFRHLCTYLLDLSNNRNGEATGFIKIIKIYIYK